MSYHLNANDFQAQQGTLMLNQSGVVLVMFTSTGCHHCKVFAPTFKSLVGSIVGVNFALCNVDGANEMLLQMSGGTSTPITSVPKFILYNNNMPYSEFTGERSKNSILRFLSEMLNKIGAKQQFTSNRPTTDLRTRPSHSMQPQQQQLPPSYSPSQPAKPKFKVNPSTGVKEYETSYGLPFNVANEAEFLAYESAYKS